MSVRMSLLTGVMALALTVPAAAQYQTAPAAPAAPAPETLAEPAPEIVTELAPGMVASTSAPLSLRAGPGMDHAAIGVIPRGAAVEVQQCVPGWCEVTYEGMTGFAADVLLETDVAAAPPAAAGQGIATSDLNLRAGAGMEHPAIAVIPEGAAVEISNCIEGRVWCEVTYAGMTGFASDNYLQTAWTADTATALTPPDVDGAAALAPPAMAEGIAQATTDLNLRAGAGMEHTPIAVIPAGESVTIHDCIPGRVWCEVSYGGITGFASQTYLN